MWSFEPDVKKLNLNIAFKLPTKEPFVLQTLLYTSPSKYVIKIRRKTSQKFNNI